MSLASDIVPYLQQIPPLNELPVEALSKCARDITVQYHVKGDHIGQYKSYSGMQAIPDDERCHPLMIIRTGAVSLHKLSSERLEQRGEGELFGHPIHFNLGVGEYQCLASEDSLIWSIPKQRVKQLCDEYASFKNWLLSASGERLLSQSKQHARYIKDLPLRAPITAQPTDSIVSCAKKMSEHRVSSLPILDGGKLIGILTDKDIRKRFVAEQLDFDSSARSIMTSHPVTAHLNENVEDALVTLMRHGIHHLPVVEDKTQSTKLCGMVTSGDLMRVHTPHPLRLVRDISRAQTTQELIQLAHNGPSLLSKLAQELKDVTQVGRIASLITDACTRRLLQLMEQKLGPPPMAYTWLAFGSQARLEQGLISDQDNGLLLATEPDGNASQYFEQLSKGVCDGLAECGYSYCNGGVMAMGKWCLPLSTWQETFKHWIAEPEPSSVMHCSIFFDMRPIYGDFSLAEQLRHNVLALAKDNHIFLRFLANESMSHKPPLGFFRQFVQEQGGDQTHGLNLKQRGVIPVVDLARVLALSGMITAVHTEERLLAAADKGLTSAEDAANLIQAQRFINRIRLEHQSRQLERGENLNHLVDPDHLSRLHRRYLRSAFNVVRAAQQALAQRFLLN